MSRPLSLRLSTIRVATNWDRSNSLRAVGWGFDFGGIVPILLYGYDKLYYRKLHLHVASRR